MQAARSFAGRLRMPAEWAPHQCTWMLWPYRTDNWRAGAAPAQEAFSRVAQAIAQYEPVNMGVVPDQMDKAQAAFRGVSTAFPISLVPMQYDDAWMRDVGPTFVYQSDEGKQSLLGIDWEFNAWGEKTATWELDRTVARQVCEHISLPSLSTPGFILEGGAIHVDGEETLLTTEECLLHSNRNHSMNKDQISQTLREYLGVREVLWLVDGQAFDDDTNGHIDNFSCFVRPGRVLLCWTDDETHPTFARCRRALEVLSTHKDAQGRSLEVVKLPLPPHMVYTSEEIEEVVGQPGAGEALPLHESRQAGNPLCGSYLNFYLCNGGLVMPSFDSPDHDNAARDILAAEFPQNRVTQVSAREILLGGGNIHCITQQVPVPPSS